jgi:hypothetical protein
MSLMRLHKLRRIISLYIERAGGAKIASPDHKSFVLVILRLGNEVWTAAVDVEARPQGSALICARYLFAEQLSVQQAMSFRCDLLAGIVKEGLAIGSPSLGSESPGWA